jgi:hypothetical protein
VRIEGEKLEAEGRKLASRGSWLSHTEGAVLACQAQTEAGGRGQERTCPQCPIRSIM